MNKKYGPIFSTNLRHVFYASSIIMGNDGADLISHRYHYFSLLKIAKANENKMS